MQAAVCTEMPVSVSPASVSILSNSCISFENLDIVVTDRASGLQENWEELESLSPVSIYQTYQWVNACLETLEVEEDYQTMIISGSFQGKTYFILPLVLEGKFIKRLRWVGGKHTNLSMGLFHPELIKNSGTKNFEALFKRIGSMIPGVSFAKLCCQPRQWGGQPNPILKLPFQDSVHKAYYLNLEQGFDAVLKAGNGKRKRKKFRSQVRMAEKVGGYRLLVVSTPSEALKILDIFRKQKALRFKKQGIRDMFSATESRRFFNKLAVAPVSEQSACLQLFALEIGGEIRAVFGGGRFGSHLSGYFSSIADDELNHISPGEMLLHLLIEYCAENGYKSLDLGCGDERYKRSWCQEQIILSDVILPLSKRALPLVYGYRAWCVVKRVIRSNDPIWKFIRKLRAKKAEFRDVITSVSSSSSS
ncbi:MAG: GNAT family N-acetyltransferase [Rhizobiaceae bacterium]|nr:GNAT family N-acetyltransferase [Rhizobiaceae bacterium]